MTRRHKAFLLIQICCFIAVIVTASLAIDALRTTRSDLVIKIFSFTKVEINYDKLTLLNFALIFNIIGSFAMNLLSLFGIHFANRNKVRALEAYIICQNVVFILHSTSIILASLYHANISEGLGVAMHSRMGTYYRNKSMILKNRLSWARDEVSQAWDIAHLRYQCCGLRISSSNPRTNPMAFYICRSAWGKSTTDKNESFIPKFPPSCCKAKNGGAYPKIKDSFKLEIEAVNDWKSCLLVDYEDNNNINKDSCYKPIANLLETYTKMALGCSVINSSLQIINQITLREIDFLNGDENVVGIEYLPDQQSLCAATNKGHLFLWRVVERDFEQVGAVESGFETMEWSPDQELIALVTGDLTLILMTRDFEVLSEQIINSESEGEGQLITVGWGKKATQFHGSEGKQAATAKLELEGGLRSTDNSTSQISWKANGEMFALSCFNKELNRRQIRIWSREGQLFSCNEHVGPIEQALSYKPSGNLVATSLHYRGKHEVIFIEKNGLQHGSFTIFGDKDDYIKQMSWNVDSTVLALVVSNSNGNERVYLYTSSNYHWCLKQVINKPVTKLIWDPEDAMILHIVTSNGDYVRYIWRWIISSSVNGTCAVIDGDLLKVTNFQDAIIPPPMCSFIIKMENPVSMVCFGDDDELLAVDCWGKVIIHSIKGSNKNEIFKQTSKLSLDQGKSEKLTKYCSKLVQLLNNLGTVCHITFHRHTIVCVSCKYGERLLNKIEIRDDFAETISSKSLDHDVVCLASLNSFVALQKNDGTVWKIDNDNLLEPMKDENGLNIQFSDVCQQMSLCKFKNAEILLIGLSKRHKLFVNNQQLSDCCTSFTVNQNFVVFTTHQHVMKFIDGETTKVMDMERRLERGSSAIISPSDTSVVLQMPRGNLECIHPRPLFLTSVRGLLNRTEYFKAITLMRKHRINMNLIYDHDPVMFMNNLDQFVHQVNSSTLINLFLADLNEQNVTKTMYHFMYISDRKNTESGCKVDLICDALRGKMTKIDFDKFLLSILTTFIKKSKREVEKALLLIKRLQDEGDKSRAEQALKHLLFLVDVNELYDVALGLYDFQLVLKVAEKSQKDPKEYIPFLKELQQLDEVYRRFVINKHLKRHKEALPYICQCIDKFEECLEFISEHSLYAEALRYFKAGSKEFENVCLRYGKYLFEKKKYDQAGLIYVKGGHYEDSIIAYEKCSLWREAISSATKSGYNPQEMALLSRRLSETLKKQRKFIEAAILIEQYAGDCEGAIEVLIEGRCWQEATRIMHKHNRLDFIQTHLNDAVLEAFRSINSTLDDLRSNFERNLNRLCVVREEKKKRAAELLYDEEDVGNADVYSDTSSVMTGSVTSGGTRSSGKSTRSRKKKERKLWSLREGSVYEHAALVDALRSIYSEAIEYKTDVTDLLRILFSTDMLDEARNVSAKYGGLLDILALSISVIWNVEFCLEASNFEDERHIREFCALKVAPDIAAYKDMSWQIEIM
ncbi:DgyrCDS3987 [Dimorphilus gyrociliatus]|uniref:Elongator complex protein 1 n=1 Tax=Dimorphilus gyrociliatus TaxID=2664684 RepID=A0A7I8VGX8_9ANNE|nr:DgyrCDS3987 [Dimorphilus gyrociliatus]